MENQNQCTQRCPRQVFEGARAKMAARSPDAGTAFLGLLGAGLRGFVQVGRESTCPQRDADPGQWRVVPWCDQAVAQGMVERPLDLENLNEHELTVLAPYIKREPPTETQ